MLPYSVNKKVLLYTFVKLNKMVQYNKWVIVNMEHIKCVDEYEFILKNEQRVSIRIRGQKQVKKKFLDYSLQEMRKDDL